MDETSKPKMMTFDIPDDPKQLQAWGEVMLRHSHLDCSLRVSIKTLTGVAIREAVDGTEFTRSTELRSRIRKLARDALGGGEALVRFEALLERCRRVTERRNDLIHNIVGREVDGDIKMRTVDHSWRDVPSIEELNALSGEMVQLTYELNEARIHGYIFDALQVKRR